MAPPIVTDGEANDANLVELYTPDVIARGITVDVVGVNMKGDHTLARKVHSYRRADDPASLHSAVSEVFAELSTRSKDDTSAANFQIIQALPDGLATAALAAMSSQHNQPVGERPASPASSIALPPSSPPPTATGPTGGQPAASPTTSTPSTLPPSGGGVNSKTIVYLAIGAIVFFAIAGRILRALRGGAS